MVEFIPKTGEAVADFCSIESTGCNGVSDKSSMSAYLRAAVSALNVPGARGWNSFGMRS